jgi:hypothetical protein
VLLKLIREGDTVPDVLVQIGVPRVSVDGGPEDKVPAWISVFVPSVMA